MSVFTRLFLTAVGTAAAAGAVYFLRKRAEEDSYDIDEFDEDFDEVDNFEDEDGAEEAAEEAPAEAAAEAEEALAEKAAEAQEKSLPKRLSWRKKFPCRRRQKARHMTWTAMA